MINIKSNEQVKTEALKKQENFTKELQNLFKKHDVKTVFFSGGIELPYETDDCSEKKPHEHRMTACVNMQTGSIIQITKLLLVLVQGVPEVKVILESVLEAEAKGIKVDRGNVMMKMQTSNKEIKY